MWSVCPYCTLTQSVRKDYCTDPGSVFPYLTLPQLSDRKCKCADLKAVWLQGLRQGKLGAIHTAAHIVTQQREGMPHVVTHCLIGCTVTFGKECLPVEEKGK